MSDASVRAWTDYWRTGQGASCFHGQATERALNEVWRSFVADLADGARVIDLAAGNGAAARECLAASGALGRQIAIDAVDAAAVQPPGPVPAQLRFHSGVRLERLPFDEATFDAAISQFGFEYAEAGPAALEAARVLRPGGQLRLVIHARDGGVFRDISARVERLNQVLAETGAATLVRTLARAAAAGDEAELARAGALLPAAVETLRRIAPGAPQDDAAMFYASAFLQDWAQRSRYRPEDLRRAIDDGWANATGVAQRQADMLRAARSREDIAELGETLRAAGFDYPTVSGISDAARGDQIAWQLDAVRASGAGNWSG
ncbi:MAG: class I SAM-dependent methyltransferase [Hyphomonas sp.]